MRVISGSARGHRLKSLDGLATRPTADRVKESLFNIITAYLPEACVLDLFAGTGNLGIEALSRGAAHADFVDKSPMAVKIIVDNLSHTGLKDRAQVHICDCNDYISKNIYYSRHYDIIFMDPPYSKGLILPILIKLDEKSFLKEDGVIIVERENSDELPEHIGSLVKVRDQKYGRTFMTFYKIG